MCINIWTKFHCRESNSSCNLFSNWDILLEVIMIHPLGTMNNMVTLLYNIFVPVPT